MLSFNKAQEQVKLSFTKAGMAEMPVVQLKFAIDFSGSMMGNFQSGIVDQTASAILAAAAVVDDNGEMEIFGFSDEAGEVGVANAGMYNTTFLSSMSKKADFELWQGTAYSSVIGLISQGEGNVVDQAKNAVEALGSFVSGLFGKKRSAEDNSSNSSKDPNLCIFITDGDCNNNDIKETRLALKASSKDTFWVMVGIGGGSSFQFLKNLDNEMDNVQFVKLQNLNIPQDQLYNAVLTKKFADWYSTHKKAS